MVDWKKVWFELNGGIKAQNRSPRQRATSNLFFNGYMTLVFGLIVSILVWDYYFDPTVFSKITPLKMAELLILLGVVAAVPYAANTGVDLWVFYKLRKPANVNG